MNAKDIVGRKFEKSFSGYRPEEVDEFLKEISSDYSALQKENRDLEKKLEVLADKIREYRNDEDVLKEALLGAQRQGNQAVTEAKEKAAKIIGDAEEKAEKLTKEADEAKKKTLEENERILAEAKEKANGIVDDATDKADKIKYDLQIQSEIQKETLTRIRNEVNEYRYKLVDGYKKHIEIIEAFPSQCENEYLNKVAADYQKDKNLTVKKASSSHNHVHEPEKIIFKNVKNEEKTLKANISEIENNIVPETSQSNSEDISEKGGKPISFEVKIEENDDLQFQPVYDEDYVEEAVEEKSEKTEKSNLNLNNINGDEGENLFFKKSSHTPLKNNKRLEFGNNIKVIKKNK